MRALRLMVASAALALAGPALAQPIQIADSGDSAWLLSASLLVLLAAVPGLWLLHGHRPTQAREHSGLPMIMAVAIISLLFAIFGFSLAFTEGNQLIGDAGNLMLADLADLHADATISDPLYALFELAGALFAVAILVSALAPRARLGWLCAFCALWFTLVYVPVAHWIWGGGWLSALGAVDFGGGLVIQLTAGIGALIAALLIGRGRDADAPGEPGFTGIALGLVWIGWLALIGGAALSSSDDSTGAIVNAQLAASAALLTGLALERWRTGAVSLAGAATAGIAGLAAISGGAGFVATGGAIAIGIAGALGAGLMSVAVERLPIGSAAAVVAPHAGGAIVGAIIFPIFMHPLFGGPGFEEGASMVALIIAQGVAVAVIILWTAGLAAVAALMTAMIVPMRATAP
jgi:ammonium transporter, Amt family